MLIRTLVCDRCRSYDSDDSPVDAVKIRAYPSKVRAAEGAQTEVTKTDLCRACQVQVVEFATLELG
jgi:hypothetical protein